MERLTESQRNTPLAKRLHMVASKWLRDYSISPDKIEKGIIDFIILYYGLLPFKWDNWNDKKASVTFSTLHKKGGHALQTFHTDIGTTGLE